MPTRDSHPARRRPRSSRFAILAAAVFRAELLRKHTGVTVHDIPRSGEVECSTMQAKGLLLKTEFLKKA